MPEKHTLVAENNEYQLNFITKDNASWLELVDKIAGTSWTLYCHSMRLAQVAVGNPCDFAKIRRLMRLMNVQPSFLTERITNND